MSNSHPSTSSANSMPKVVKEKFEEQEKLEQVFEKQDFSLEKKSELISLSDNSSSDAFAQKIFLSETDTLLGKEVGNFKIIEKIGHGGFGAVYRATHLFLEQDFAIKILHSNQPNRVALAERFRREAKALACLSHDNVVYLSDFGLFPGYGFYLVMECIEGQSLQELIAGHENGELSLSRIGKIMKQLCDVLSFIHKHKIIHRDLKPGNVLLVENDLNQDFVKLIDFGIASLQAGDDDKELTRTGTYLGTARYVSPEQAKGEKSLDGRSDLYSLGIILYEMLTGTTPFQHGNTIDLIHQHLRKVPPLLKERVSDRSWAIELEQFLQRVLSKSPSLRPKNAKAFWESCEEVLLAQEKLEQTKRNSKDKELIFSSPLLSSFNDESLFYASSDSREGVLVRISDDQLQAALVLPKLQEMSHASLHDSSCGIPIPSRNFLPKENELDTDDELSIPRSDDYWSKKLLSRQPTKKLLKFDPSISPPKVLVEFGEKSSNESELQKSIRGSYHSNVDSCDALLEQTILEKAFQKKPSQVEVSLRAVELEFDETIIVDFAKEKKEGCSIVFVASDTRRNDAPNSFCNVVIEQEVCVEESEEATLLERNNKSSSGEYKSFRKSFQSWMLTGLIFVAVGWFLLHFFLKKEVKNIKAEDQLSLLIHDKGLERKLGLNKGRTKPKRRRYQKRRAKRLKTRAYLKRTVFLLIFSVPFNTSVMSKQKLICQKTPCRVRIQPGVLFEAVLFANGYLPKKIRRKINKSAIQEIHSRLKRMPRSMRRK